MITWSSRSTSTNLSCAWAPSCGGRTSPSFLFAIIGQANELGTQFFLFSGGEPLLIIAHRLATVRNADRIVVLAEEGIAEEGGHQELLQRGGIYSRLHQAQAGA